MKFAERKVLREKAIGAAELFIFVLALVGTTLSVQGVADEWHPGAAPLSPISTYSAPHGVRTPKTGLSIYRKPGSHSRPECGCFLYANDLNAADPADEPAAETPVCLQDIDQAWTGAGLDCLHHKRTDVSLKRPVVVMVSRRLPARCRLGSCSGLVRGGQCPGAGGLPPD